MMKNKSILIGWHRVLLLYLTVKSRIHLFVNTAEIRKMLVSPNAI